MGIYLVSVDAGDWFGSNGGTDGVDGFEDEGGSRTGDGFKDGAYEEDDAGHAAVASALDDVLRARGLPPYVPGPTTAGPRGWFEEKAAPPMTGFDALCRARLTEAERNTLYGWTVLVPLSLDEPIPLPVGSAYSDDTLVAGAPQVLALAERLAGTLGLPLDVIPSTGAQLELSFWFAEGAARKTAATRPGPWTEDLDTAFYVTLYLRAAAYSLRHGCPMAYS